MFFFLTDNCQGVCFLHPVPRSTNPPGTTTVTKIVTTKGKTSTERDIAAVSGKIADWLTILIDWGYIKEQLPKISLILFVCLFFFGLVLFCFVFVFVFVLICCCLFFVFLFLSVPVSLRLVFSCFWFCFIWLFCLYASLLVVDVVLFLCAWQSLRDLFAFDIDFPSFRSFVRLKVGQSL